MNHFLEEFHFELILVPFALAAFMLIQIWS